MATDNSVTITGNATREPEVRFTPGGAQVASFGVAVNRRWQNRQTQQWEEDVSFFDVSCWNQLAANAAETVGRGTRVTVTGRLDQRSWETPQGDKRSKVEIVADDIAISLKWATATVMKNPREDNQGGYQNSGGGGGGGGSYQQPAGGEQGRSFGSPQQPSSDYNPDEEPF